MRGHFKVGTSTGPNALLFESGTLAGSLTPRTALSATTGACSVSTPTAQFAGLTYTGAKVALTSSSGTFDLDVPASNLDATNGTWTKTNALSGTLSIGTTAYTVPSDAKGLNPPSTRRAVIRRGNALLI